MRYQSLLKLGVACTTGGGALIAFKSKVLDDYGYFPKFGKSAFAAATVETAKWDNNWDKRNHEKPKASRHIFLIRHGQYNLGGKSDAEKTLTALGKEQAVYTGLRLKALGLDQKISFILESTMTRAHETSALIYKQLDNDSIPVESSDLLREGIPIEPDHSGTYSTPEPRTFVDGSQFEFAFRHFLHRADVDQEKDSYEIIVCHGNIIGYFVCRLLQLPPEGLLQISFLNASITQISIRPNGRVSLKALGDTGHLPADKLTFK